MKLYFRKATVDELGTALMLLKQAAEMLQQKKVDQWSFWLNPPADKINWVREGFENGEFYFVESSDKELVGMYRLLSADELYWGTQADTARYIHSLVVSKQFAGKQIGSFILENIEKTAMSDGVFKLRLDCNAGNPALCNYYEKQGYVKVGEKQMPHSLNNLYEKELLVKK